MAEQAAFVFWRCKLGEADDRRPFERSFVADQLKLDTARYDLDLLTSYATGRITRVAEKFSSNVVGHGHREQRVVSAGVDDHANEGLTCLTGHA